jgi:hypothetical protein
MSSSLQEGIVHETTDPRLAAIIGRRRRILDILENPSLTNHERLSLIEGLQQQQEAYRKGLQQSGGRGAQLPRAPLELLQRRFALQGSKTLQKQLPKIAKFFEQHNFKITPDEEIVLPSGETLTGDAKFADFVDYLLRPNAPRPQQFERFLDSLKNLNFPNTYILNKQAAKRWSDDAAAAATPPTPPAPTPPAPTLGKQMPVRRRRRRIDDDQDDAPPTLPTYYTPPRSKVSRLVRRLSLVDGGKKKKTPKRGSGIMQHWKFL